jgi:hypothetical protein
VKFPPTIRLFFVPSRNSSPNEYLDGYTEQPGGRTVCVDIVDARMSMVRLLLHEVIHVWHPSWSEHRVIEETRKRFNKMTWKGKLELLQTAFAQAKVGYPPKEEDKHA